MRKSILAVMLAAVALMLPLTGHALTKVAGCNVSAANFGVVPGCGVSFLCPAHTMNLRAVPVDFDFVGIVHIYFTDGTSVVEQDTEWVTGRVQVDGPDFTTVLPVAGASCYMGVDTLDSAILPPLSGGSAGAVAEA